MAAARSLLFQLPRFVSSSRMVGMLYRRASPSTSTGLQRMLAAAATSHKLVAAHSEGAGDAIVATSRLPREAGVAAELLAEKRRVAPSPKGRPDKPNENSDKDKHHDVPDKKVKEGKQAIWNGTPHHKDRGNPCKKLCPG